MDQEVSFVTKLPTLHQGNRICKPKTLKCAHFDGRFPLFARGSDRQRFEYGVFLLNKNIELILFSCGIRITDLRYILPNLELLFRRARKKLQRPLSSSFSESKPIRSSQSADNIVLSLSRSQSPQNPTSLIQRALSRFSFNRSRSSAELSGSDVHNS